MVSTISRRERIHQTTLNCNITPNISSILQRLFHGGRTEAARQHDQIDAKKMNVSAASLAPDSSVRKATPSDNTERTARSGAVVETIFLSRPRRAQCISGCMMQMPTECLCRLNLSFWRGCFWFTSVSLLWLWVYSQYVLHYNLCYELPIDTNY